MGLFVNCLDGMLEYWKVGKPELNKSNNPIFTTYIAFAKLQRSKAGRQSFFHHNYQEMDKRLLLARYSM